MQTIVIKSDDNHLFKLFVQKADLPKRNTVIVCMPAMGVNARFYFPLMRELNAQGLHAVCADLRGIGESSIRPSRKNNFGYAEIVQQDYPAIIRETRSIFPNSRIILMGHSLGGQLASLYIAAHPEQVDGLILIASGSVFFNAYPFPRKLNILIGTQLFRFTSEILGVFPGKKLGFGGTESVGVMRDWSYQARTGHYRPRKSNINFEKLMADAKIPLLGITIEGDQLAPKHSLDHLCSKFKSATIKRWHYIPTEKQNSFDHFSWAKRSGVFVEEIVNWLQNTFLEIAV